MGSCFSSGETERENRGDRCRSSNKGENLATRVRGYWKRNRKNRSCKAERRLSLDTNGEEKGRAASRHYQGRGGTQKASAHGLVLGCVTKRKKGERERIVRGGTDLEGQKKT